MKKSEVIDQLEDVVVLLKGDGSCDDLISAVRYAIAVIQGGVTDKSHEWILCSEQLPEINEEVFVYLFRDSPYLAWYDGHEWQTEDFTVDDDDERPTAWMSLPKPWKGEVDD